MRALVQRVAGASVSVDGIVGRIGGGLVVFVGVGRGDDEADARYVVEKIANLRIFEDEDGRFNLSALDVSAELLDCQPVHALRRRASRPQALLRGRGCSGGGAPAFREDGRAVSARRACAWRRDVFSSA